MHSQARFITMKETEQNKWRKRGMWWSLGDVQSKLPCVLSQWSHTWHTWFPQHWVVTTHAKCCQPAKLVSNSVPRVFIGVLCQYLLSAVYQHYRFPRIPMNLIIHTDKHKEPLFPVLGMMGILRNPSSQTPANDQPLNEAGLFLKDSSQVCYVNFVCNLGRILSGKRGRETL